MEFHEQIKTQTIEQELDFSFAWFWKEVGYIG